MKISTHCKEQWMNSICLPSVRMSCSHSWWGFHLSEPINTLTMWGSLLFHSCFYFQTQKNSIHIWCIWSLTSVVNFWGLWPQETAQISPKSCPKNNTPPTYSQTSIPLNLTNLLNRLVFTTLANNNIF